MDFATYFRFVVVLILVIGLILGFAWVMRRFGFGGALQGALGRKRRLAIIEAMPLDNRHRVYLVRRDDVEHLVLVGPNTSHVIERAIAVTADSAEPPPQQGFAAFSQFLPKDKDQ